MPSIAYSGKPDSKIWVITETPYTKDFDKGTLMSSPYGYVFHKMWSDSGLTETPFITCLKPDPDLQYDDSMQRDDLVKEINRYKPPIILPMGKRVAALFCPSTIIKRKAKKKVTNEIEVASLDKYAGSLLVSPFINHDHYCIPQYSPDYIVADWSYRDIAISLDYGHVREEYEYYVKFGQLQPLPNPTLVIHPTYEDLCTILSDYIDTASHVSTDIETIRPPKKSTIHAHHPGYPYTMGFAKSPLHGVSFSFWDYTTEQLVKIWRLVDAILTFKKQIGQNYFSFDSHFLQPLGFDVDLNLVSDTMIRHHVLWPELEHKLQFLTKQYTRQPYYKDEGKTWSPKNKGALMRYNALDAVTTYQVFLGQEDEFKERSHLL